MSEVNIYLSAENLTGFKDCKCLIYLGLNEKHLCNLAIIEDIISKSVGVAGYSYLNINADTAFKLSYSQSDDDIKPSLGATQAFKAAYPKLSILAISLPNLLLTRDEFGFVLTQPNILKISDSILKAMLSNKREKIRYYIDRAVKANG